MNRILLEAPEIDGTGRARLTGRRAQHIRETLRLNTGQWVRVGAVNGPRGTAELVGDDADSLTLQCRFDQSPPPRAPVDLLLAMPRPKVLKRLWAAIASLGVDRMVILRAAKVERCYFDTHWLDPANYRPLLLEGLEQSGDTQVPQVLIRREFQPFVEDELDAVFPGGTRVLGHPGSAGRAFQAQPGQNRIVVAVGPEGGWTDFELDLFRARGFGAWDLGWRTLRTDTACVALLTLAHLALDTRFGNQPR
jgi:RsmE family RNA methyltransferase